MNLQKMNSRNIFSDVTSGMSNPTCIRMERQYLGNMTSGYKPKKVIRFNSPVIATII